MNIRNATAAFIVSVGLVTGSVQAATVNVGSTGMVSVDGTTYTLVTTSPEDGGLMWEETSPSSGVYKACICSMFSFRALQAISEYLGISDMNTASTTIVSAWSTDGPEHVFTDTMGWKVGSNFIYTDPITASPSLTLDDAWLTFTIGSSTYKVSSLAENYDFIDDTNHAGYQAGWDFFDYRRYFQTNPGMDDTKMYFRDVVRAQIVTNFTDGATFDVRPVPEPTTLFSMGLGITVLALSRRKRTLLGD